MKKKREWKTKPTPNAQLVDTFRRTLAQAKAEGVPWINWQYDEATSECVFRLYSGSEERELFRVPVARTEYAAFLAHVREVGSRLYRKVQPLIAGQPPGTQGVKWDYDTATSECVIEAHRGAAVWEVGRVPMSEVEFHFFKIIAHERFQENLARLLEPKLN